jgi:hypothetical protein
VNRKNSVARRVTTIAGPFLNAATRLFRYSDGLTVFLFHEVTERPSEFLKSTGMWVSGEVFQHQLNWIKKNFQVIPITHLTSNKKLPRNAAIITFDDSWEGMVDAIEKYLLPSETPACLFLNFGAIVDGVDISAAERFLSFQNTNSDFKPYEILPAINCLPKNKYKTFLKFQGDIVKIESIHKLAENPNITISNHSFHHFDSSRMNDTEFIDNYVQNNKWVRQFSENGGENFFAFPFGTPEVNFESKHIQMLSQKGVKFCFSGTGRRLGKYKSLPQLIPRVHFSPADHSRGNIWWACYKNQILKR